MVARCDRFSCVHHMVIRIDAYMKLQLPVLVDNFEHCQHNMAVGNLSASGTV